jgi:signal peptidase II
MNSMLRSTRAWLPIAVLVVVIDQITKAWAINELVDRNIELFWTLRFNLSFNTGMAFGQGRDLGPIIAVVAMVVVVVVLLRMRPDGGRLANIAIGLIIGGAVGNIIDRLFRGRGWLRGGVVDFIDFQWFPIFNVADMGITIGGALLVLASFLANRVTAEEPVGTHDFDDVVTGDPS